MKELRNPDGKLIAMYDATSGTSITGALEIKAKRWTTRIEFGFDGEPTITHIKA